MTEELPKGWCSGTISGVAETIFGQSPPSSSYNSAKNGLPFFQGKSEFGMRHPTPQKWCTEPKREALPGDILISVRAPVGPTNVANQHCAIGRGLAAIRPNINPEFVRFWMQLSEQVLAAQGTGTTFSAISKAILNSHEIPVAPLNEQRRIVDKVETLFARLDKGEEAVREVQKLLKRYRQSVLKSALTGELTADWRAEREGELESGADLLARILKSREENWQGRGKYKAPVSPDTSDLTNLPTGWTWTSVDALISDGPKNGIYLPKSKYGSGTPIIRIDDFQTGWVRQRAELRCVAAEKAEQIEYSLRENDLVINRVNSVSHLGKVLLVRDEHDGCLFESNMMRLKITDECHPNFVAMYLASEIGRKRLISNCKHAVNQASINQGDVKATPIPLPPVAEQIEIFSTVNAYLESVKAVERACEIELKRSTALRQSILKDAFSGRLVPQDPNDEPASALLERIQQSKKKRK